jgi:hypothetical protein
MQSGNIARLKPLLWKKFLVPMDVPWTAGSFSDIGHVGSIRVYEEIQ